VAFNQWAKIDSTELAVFDDHFAMNDGVSGVGAGAQHQTADRVVDCTARKIKRSKIEQSQISTHAYFDLPDIFAPKDLCASGRGLHRPQN